MNFKEFLHIYAIGSIGYMFIEVLWRGYTHWSMGIVGGICMYIIYSLEIILANMNLITKAFFASACITVLELFTGIVVNKFFGLGVWDYSELKLNFMGQISAFYSFLWFLLCIPTLLLCKLLRRRVFGVMQLSGWHLAKIFERQPNLRQEKR